MTDSPLSLRDYLPVITALGGLLVGGFISELQTVLAGARERRKALNVLLYELLELRSQVHFSNPRTLLGLLSRYALSRFGPQGDQAFQRPDVRRLLSHMLQQAATSLRGDLATRYLSAVGALAPFDPILTYRLHGQSISRFETVIGQWYEHVRNQPEVVSDPSSPAILAKVEEKTLDLVAAEALRQLSADIGSVARACGWWTALRARSILKRQDDRTSERLDSEFAGKLDQWFASLVEAIQPPPAQP